MVGTTQEESFERYSIAKKDWVEKLKKEMIGVDNFSLVIFDDANPTEEIPREMSVCRVDNSYAWLIAVSEHNSTAGFRDVMITGEESVKLIAAYFEKRLWTRGKMVINRGKAVV